MATSRIRSGDIAVEGLAALSKALKEIDPDLAKELRKTNKTVADLVAKDAQSAAMSIGGVAAKTAPTIKASAGIRSAGVAFGGPSAPWAAGAEFGAGHDRPRNTNRGTIAGWNQFPAWRGSGSDAGYFVYPSIRRDADRIETEYKQAIDRLVERAFGERA